MRIALISDLHNSKITIEYRPGGSVARLLPAFLDELRKNEIDIVVELGDRVGNIAHDHDLENLIEVSDIFSQTDFPVFHLMGNHDLHFLSENENLSILGMNSSYYAIDSFPFKLIFLNTSELIADGVIMPGKNQIEWLKKEIEDSDKKIVLFSHHPLICQNQTGNPFFINNPHGYKVKDERQMLQFASGGNVLASFNGHVHWSYCTLEKGVPFISVPSFVESFPDTENAPGSFMIADINEKLIDVSLETLFPRRTIGRVVLPIG